MQEFQANFQEQVLQSVQVEQLKVLNQYLLNQLRSQKIQADSSQTRMRHMRQESYNTHADTSVDRKSRKGQTEEKPVAQKK